MALIGAGDFSSLADDVHRGFLLVVIHGELDVIRAAAPVGQRAAMRAFTVRTMCRCPSDRHWPRCGAGAGAGGRPHPDMTDNIAEQTSSAKNRFIELLQEEQRGNYVADAPGCWHDR